MRKYLSLGSALMMGVVLGKESKTDTKLEKAQKYYIGEVVYLKKPPQVSNHHKHSVKREQKV
jgi:cystathionine beta-lyase/cystathionine gamma-synthase